MKTRERLILSAIVFVAGGIFSIFFSTALHQILSKQITTLRFIGLSECIASIASSRQHFMMFLSFMGFTAILSVMFFITNLRPYQSHLKKVTPEIETPAAVGQFQHGSAKWLNDKEKDKAFESFVLDSDDEQIAKLIKGGYEGLDFMRESNTSLKPS